MAAKVINIEDFFTREKSNEGILVPLNLPDGTPTEHWIKIRGIDSDAFRKAEAESKRKMMEFARDLADKKLTPEQEREARQAFVDQSRLELIAALAFEWSFPVELNKEMITKFLTEAPNQADILDRLAYDRVAFFKKKSMPS